MKLTLTPYTAAMVAVLACANPVFASDRINDRPPITLAQATTDSVDWVIQGLWQAGYRVISVKSTFLGRIRIVAENRTHQREIIVSRSTGVIFRDRIESLNYGKSDSSPTKAPAGSLGGGTTTEAGSRDRSLIDVGTEGGGIGLDVDISKSSQKDQIGGSGGIGGATGSISDLVGGE